MHTAGHLGWALCLLGASRESLGAGLCGRNVMGACFVPVLGTGDSFPPEQMTGDPHSLLSR